MRTRLSRLVGLAALLPVLVFAVSGLRWNQFRCLMSGMVTEDRCCGSPNEVNPEVDSPATPVASAIECCQHEVVVASRPPSELPAGKATPAPPVTEVSIAIVIAPVLPAAVVGAASPPRPKSPLVLLKHSLLI